ncbi:hypothetical protein O181_115799 [Austropuccinia psidii MF-1]|uniref:Uncharacterized protein n=1 Tax=Austropuccinia psidii MF-1 TaxID=1389203 RepID=A0A9Q3KAA5_9BASI|nr:hypothetical protein [Austropuccinia psidii MF-1]
MNCSDCKRHILAGYRYCTACGVHFHLLESQTKKVTDPSELGISVVSPLRSPHMASQTTTTTPAAPATAANTAASTGATTKTATAATVVGASTSAAGSQTKSSAKATKASK